MDPKQLSEELRQGQNPYMTRRRWIIGLSMLGGSMGQAVTLYQTGIVNHLPDPPGQKLFDADRVDLLITLTTNSTHPGGQSWSLIMPSLLG